MGESIPVSDQDPAAHSGRQPDGDDVPGNEKVSLTHFWQLESEDEPSWSLKVPAGQGLGAYGASRNEAGLGWAWRGKAWPGEARAPMAHAGNMAWPGEAGPGWARQGRLWRMRGTRRG